MNFQQLQCFIYVAERLNFTKAAEALYLSVPTVTHHIKNLEEELGIQLFYRSSRVVKLTEQGEKFYYNAKDIVLRMQEAKDQLQKNKEHEMIKLRIGCMSEKEFVILEKVLKQIKKQYPFIQPKIIVSDFFSLKNLYENQQLELVICTQGLSKKSLFKEINQYQSYAVLPLDHPLTNKQSISFNEIENETLITLPPRCMPFEKNNKFQENLTLHEQDHTHIVSEGEGESILLTKCGYGIAILPGFMLGYDEEVKYIPIDQSKNIHYGIYYKSEEEHILFFIKEYQKLIKKEKLI